MTTLAFDALEYRADQSFATARYRFVGDEQRGWTVERDGKPALALGPGYRALRVRQCGVCSTDLARHHLPFPLPQVIGHEVVAVDADGRRYVVEINASHEARGVAHTCAFCQAGLPTHCPDRVTLGIHDLPGGFGPWILAPVAACLEVPPTIPDDVAVLVEPFAAALHAVRTIAPGADERIAVLGPRRLGMLVVAALAAVRTAMNRHERGFDVAAVVRDPALAGLARTFGATEAHVLNGPPEALARAFDVVIDTTGNPDGLATAVALARREVHLKSTHGQPACGLHRLTDLVVDEIGIARFPREAPVADSAPWSALRTGPRARVAWTCAKAPPAWLTATADVQRGDAATLAAHYARATAGLPRADVVVADSAAGVDAAIRPRPGHEQALVRPRGLLLLHADADTSTSPLLAAIGGRGLRLSSSRCGGFRQALDLLASTPELARLGERLVTHTFAGRDLAQAFTVARSRGCIKAVVQQEPVQ